MPAPQAAQANSTPQRLLLTAVAVALCPLPRALVPRPTVSSLSSLLDVESEFCTSTPPAALLWLLVSVSSTSDTVERGRPAVRVDVRSVSRLELALPCWTVGISAALWLLMRASVVSSMKGWCCSSGARFPANSHGVPAAGLYVAVARSWLAEAVVPPPVDALG